MTFVYGDCYIIGRDETGILFISNNGQLFRTYSDFTYCGLAIDYPWKEVFKFKK